LNLGFGKRSPICQVSGRLSGRQGKVGGGERDESREYDFEIGRVVAGIARQIGLDIGLVGRRVQLIAHLGAGATEWGSADEREMLKPGSRDVGVDAAEVDDVLGRVKIRDRVVGARG
jgi:hypothetical protein